MNRDNDATESTASGGLPVDAALILDAACNRFENEWRRGGRPDVSAAVADLPASVRGAAARELIELEVYYRRQGGGGAGGGRLPRSGCRRRLELVGRGDRAGGRPPPAARRAAPAAGPSILRPGGPSGISETMSCSRKSRGAVWGWSTGHGRCRSTASWP